MISLCLMLTGAVAIGLGIGALVALWIVFYD